jgi:hypothetical protein
LYTVAGPKCGGETSRRAALHPGRVFSLENAGTCLPTRWTTNVFQTTEQAYPSLSEDASIKTEAGRRHFPTRATAPRPRIQPAFDTQGSLHRSTVPILCVFFEPRKKPIHCFPEMNLLRGKWGGDTSRRAPLHPGRAFSLQRSSHDEKGSD